MGGIHTRRAGRRAVMATCALLAACAGETQRLEASSLDDYARFGRSVSVSGLRAAVGAYQEGSREGAVYTYVRRGDVWSLDQRITSPSPADEEFGSAVAISGTFLAIGAPRDHQPGALRSGSVYVYERDAAVGWELAATLRAPYPRQPWEAFGGSVAIDADAERLVMGAVDRDHSGATDAGAAFVFERSSAGTWFQTDELTAPAPAASDKFGSEVAIDGDTVAVAALRRDLAQNADAGSVFIFEPDAGGALALDQTLTAGDAATGDIFGAGLALEELPGGARRLVIGAGHADLVGANDAGAVYVFDAPAAGSFAEVAKLVASDGFTTTTSGARWPWRGRASSWARRAPTATRRMRARPTSTTSPAAGARRAGSRDTATMRTRAQGSAATSR